MALGNHNWLCWSLPLRMPARSAQAEPAATVRRWLADTCAAAVRARSSAAVLLSCAQALQGLLADAEASIAKQAVLSLHVLMHAALAMHALQVRR